MTKDNPFKLPSTRRAYEEGQAWAESRLNAGRPVEAAYEAAAFNGFRVEPEANAFVVGALSVLED